MLYYGVCLYILNGVKAKDDCECIVVQLGIAKYENRLYIIYKNAFIARTGKCLPIVKVRLISDLIMHLNDFSVVVLDEILFFLNM